MAAIHCQCGFTYLEVPAMWAVHGKRFEWSIQEIRRLALKLAQRRIQPASIIAWSLWRRAHQAATRRAHLKSKKQL